MNKIPFEDGKKIANAYVTINGQNYEVHPAEYEGTVPFSAQNMNNMQTNIENAINEVDNKTDDVDAKFEKQITVQQSNVILNNIVNANTNYVIPLSYQVR